MICIMTQEHSKWALIEIYLGWKRMNFLLGKTSKRFANTTWDGCWTKGLGAVTKWALDTRANK